MKELGPTLSFEDLTNGKLGISPVYGSFLAEAASHCLHYNHHGNPVLLHLTGDLCTSFLRHRERISNKLVDDRMYRSRLGSTREREAEDLAYDLLMPRALIADFRSSGRSDPVESAERFNVPLHVMKRRLGIKD